MKKNRVEVITGVGKLVSPNRVQVEGKVFEARHIVIATGARYRSFPGLRHDGVRLIGAWEAVKMETLPKSVGIVGAGAIGVEFAYFWKAFGVDVHIFELQPRLLPVEDGDCSLEVGKAYQRLGIKMSLGLEQVLANNNGKDVTVTAVAKGKKEAHGFEMGLIAVGMLGNVEQIGLEEIGIKTEGGFVQVNRYGQTNVDNVYAIGDVAGPPLLAHAASHEGLIAVEHLAGLKPRPLDKMNIPSCTYCYPQVASVGYSEEELKKEGVEYSVGKLPFSANGKAVASGETSGFVKTLLGRHGELLGAHITGENATELIHEYVLFRTMEGVDEEMFSTVHPHPTLGEFLAESVLAARGRALNF